MGIQQSREEAETTLKILRGVTPQMFASAKDKLIDLTRFKCKMYVTKWELLLILQMNARDVKSVSQFITGEEDPTTIDANSLYLLLVLTNRNIKPETKIELILSFICFESQLTEEDESVIPRATLDEVKYIFQLAYTLLNRVTDLDLLNRPYQMGDQDLNNFYGCQAEKALIHEIFAEDPAQAQAKGHALKDVVEQKSVAARFFNNDDIRKFVMLFQSGKVENIVKQAPSQVTKQLKVHTGNLNIQDTQSSHVEGVDSDHASESLDSKLAQSRMGQTMSKQEDDLLTTQQSARVAIRTSKRISEAAESSANNVLITQSEKVNLPEEKTEDKISPRIKGKQIDKSLNQRSPYSMVKMSKKILELRNEINQEIGIYEQTETIQKSENNIQHVLNRNMDMYSQKQLLPSLLSHFSMKKAKEAPPGSGSTILQAVADAQTKAMMSNIDYDREVSFPTPQLQAQSLFMSTVKKTLRNTFEEFLMEQRTFLKYEIASLQPQLMHFYVEYGSRGIKRSLEQQKFRMLGQIQTLRSFFSSLVETNFDLDLIQGDKLYTVIYQEMDNLYKCNIDQKFLVDMIDLKDKKRESQRFILYLEGAEKCLDFIVQNELLNVNPSVLNIPNQFMDARSAIKNKLSTQRTINHIEIIKLYHFCKIQMLNYFTSLGKLKALYKIVQVNKRGRDAIQDMLTEHIKKLQLRLEQVDIQMTQNIQIAQVKRRIYVQYYEALGKMSVIKCGVKGISFDHVLDYWSLHVCQQRTQEATWLMINMKGDQEERAHNYGLQQQKQNTSPQTNSYMMSPKSPAANSTFSSQVASVNKTEISKQFREQVSQGKMMFQKLTSKDITDIYNLQIMKTIDKLFNVGVNKEGDEYEGCNYAQFRDELEYHLERITKYSATFANFTQNDNTDKQRSSQIQNFEFIGQIAKSILTRIYINSQSYIQLNNVLRFFDNTQNQKESKDKLVFFLDHSQAKKSEIKSFSEMLKENDKFDNYVYEFFPICKDLSDITVPQDDEDEALNSMMNGVSSCFKNIFQDDTRRINNKNRQDALDGVIAFLQRLLKSSTDQFEEQFASQRDNIFTPGIEAIFQMNKKGMINGFNLQYFSMPVEHSMQQNYWSYQVIKLYLKDQIKNKIMFDISLVAQMNDLNVFQLAGLSGALVDQSKSYGSGELINITHGMSPLQSDNRGSPLGQSSPGYDDGGKQQKKSIYSEIFNLLTCANEYDRKGKQSMFKMLIKQLEYKQQSYSNKVEILREASNQLQVFANQMSKLKTFYSAQLVSKADEHILQSNFEIYEVALNNFNKVSNSTKNVDNVLTGSIKYLNSLCEALNKEIGESDSSPMPEGNPAIYKGMSTDFILKIRDQIQHVQNGLRNRAKNIMDQLQKDAENRSNSPSIKNKQKTPIKSAAQSKQQSTVTSPKSVNSTQAKATRDQFEQDLTNIEKKIIAQLMQIQNLTDVLIKARMFGDDPQLFKTEVDRRLISINAQLTKIQQLLKYLYVVCYMIDSQTNNLEQQKDIDLFKRGGHIINNVLSGNIVDQIEVYATSGVSAASANNNNDSLVAEPDATPSRPSTTADRKDKKTDLTSAQKCLNYLTNFLRVICLQDDQISSMYIIKSSSLFFVSQHSMLVHSLNKDCLEQKYCMKHSLEKLLNLQQIQSTPVTKYLESYQKQTEYVRKELFNNIIVNETQILKHQFSDIMSLSARQVVEASINKIDDVFSEAHNSLQDEEKTDFSNAQTKLRRTLDSNYRIFKEYLDFMSNKNYAQFHLNSQKQQNIKMSQMVTSMNTLVHIYYLKQLQQQEDYMWSIQQVQKNITNQEKQNQNSKDQLQDGTATSNNKGK